MKRAFLVLSVLLALLVVTAPISAQTTSSTLELTPTPTPTPVEYTLPYPGLLPDSPLYKLKAIRDFLVSTLIADPTKKATFDVLQADKRVAASQDLFAEFPSKKDLGIETFSKAENYFSQALGEEKLAKQQGQSTYDILQKLQLSNAKHLEIIHQLEVGQTGQIAQELHYQEQRVKEFGKEVMHEGLK